MTDEFGRRRPPLRPPGPPRAANDDEVVDIPAPRPRAQPPREPFKNLVDGGPGSTIGEVLRIQQKMALQLDGFGVAMNSRFDLFHEELAMLRQVVTVNHAPRIEAVEKTIGQKVARGGGIAGIIIVALPLLSEVLPKWATVFESIAEYLR
jgi:hypothetical protein